MRKTIVVGAGAAGLAAARMLARSGAEVSVLDARDRVGGRVRWITIPGSNETAELGAEFIHGPAPETRALLAETNTHAETREGESWIAMPDGSLQPERDEFLEAASLFEKSRGLREDESVDAFLERARRDGADEDAIAHARQFVEGFDAADPARAGVFGIEAEWSSGVDSQSARPSRGYAPLIERLRDDAVAAGASIMLNARVERVEWSATSVTACTTTGMRYDGDAMVVTLPIGVLRDDAGPRFVPSLPIEKRTAIERIESGDVARLVLLFRDAFWERVANGRYGAAGFIRAPYGNFRAYWTQAPKRMRTVVAWTGGPQAVRLLAMSTAELGALAAREFGALLGDERTARDRFQEAYLHDWTADPFARGAYSYLGVGGAYAREELAKSVDGVLFFAGEATASGGQGGTVNGAIVSGLRAASEVLHAPARTT